MTIENSVGMMEALVIRLTPHEAEQLWRSINADNSVAKEVDAACHKFFHKHSAKAKGGRG